MNQQVRIGALIGIAGLAAAANAQDSVSNNGLSDAFNPYDLTRQRVAYIVDLAGTTSSWGNQFGVGPIMKSPAVDTANFFNNLLSANGISQTNLTDVPFPSSSYSLWTGAGFGVGPNNSAGEPVLPPPSGTQFAALAADFGLRYNGVTSVIVNYNPADPARLFVTRINSAVNGLDPAADNSQFGVGSIDADGNAYIRADDFGPTNGANRLLEDNIFRIDNLARNASQTNHISNLLAHRDAGATTHLVQSSVTSINVPSAIPEDISPSRVYVGSNGAMGFVRGSSFPTTTDSSHFTGSGAVDHRGAVSFSPHAFFGGSVGTLAILAKSALAGRTDSLLMFGVSASGAVSGNHMFTPASAISDPTDAYTSDPGGFGFPYEFDHYRSQTFARGGNGQVAIGYNPFGGFGVIAAARYEVGGATDSYNSIVVGHFDPANPSNVTWVLAGWQDILAVSGGKPIKDGPGGTVIGEMTTLDDVTGGSRFGPSVSAPAIDAAGNIWFLTAAEQYKVDQFGVPFIDFDTILVRAVYDAATGGYELERVIEPGFTRTGPNSNTEYTLTFLGIADSNSIDSATLFSNGVNQSAWNNLDPTDYSQQDPRTFGGVVLRAELSYVTGEEYEVLLYIGNTTPADDEGCLADLSGSSDPNDPAYGVPDGIVDSSDFFFYLDQFVANNLAVADLSGSSDPNDPAYGVPDGQIDASDFFYYLDLFVLPCP